MIFFNEINHNNLFNSSGNDVPQSYQCREITLKLGFKNCLRFVRFMYFSLETTQSSYELWPLVGYF